MRLRTTNKRAKAIYRPRAPVYMRVLSRTFYPNSMFSVETEAAAKAMWLGLGGSPVIGRTRSGWPVTGISDQTIESAWEFFKQIDAAKAAR